MDLNTWKPLVAQTMQKLGYWLLKQQDSNPYPVYSTLTGLILWSLVEQVVQTDQLSAAMGGLYAVATGDGANIIPRQVETWIKQGDQLTEAEVIADTGHLIENSDVCDYLDEMIAKLDAMRSVQPFLTAYPQWQQQLINELKRLGNLSRFQATLTGDGAIA